MDPLHVPHERQAGVGDRRLQAKLPRGAEQQRAQHAWLDGLGPLLAGDACGGGGDRVCLRCAVNWLHWWSMLTGTSEVILAVDVGGNTWGWECGCSLGSVGHEAAKHDV